MRVIIVLIAPICLNVVKKTINNQLFFIVFSEHALAMMMKSFYRIINHKNMNLAVWTKYWLFLLFLNSCSKTVNSFNVDVTSKVIHNAPARSCQDGDCMFGFSVAQHREQDKPW